MAQKIHNMMHNPTLNHITSIKSTTIHPFGQVSLPKKSIIRSSSVSTVSSTTASVAPANDSGSFWREIQGSYNWDDLVDPLHPLLQQEIIRYGEFVTACYKAFDLDSNSKRYLHCKYGKNSLFEEVGMGDCGYQVTKYIYATPDVNSIPMPNGDHHSCGRWIGYVAVASDDTAARLGRRDILVSFRGTVTNHEWIANLMSSLTPARLDPHNRRQDVKVESGFLSLYTSDENDKFGLGSCREQLLSEVSRLLDKYKGEESVSITLAGHSMGSSLALLLAYDIAELGLCQDPQPVSRQSTSHHVCCLENRQQQIPITVFSFGGPRVGNMAFKERCEELGVKVLRIVNKNDPITKLPGVFFNENFRVLGGKYELPWSYSHVGVEIALDFFNVQKPSCVHDLETYISLIKNRRKVVHEDKDSFQVDNSRVLDWARQFFLSSAQNFSMKFPWVDVATSMVSMIQ